VKGDGDEKIQKNPPLQNRAAMKKSTQKSS
jgi:hypothetical protein